LSRAAFVPTAEQRANVTLLIGFGLTEDEICQLVRNPKGRPIDGKTLRKHFADEIAAGLANIKAQVGNRIVATILGREGGLKDERTQALLMIFFAKTRMGWKETVVTENVGKDGGPIIWQSYPEDDKL
jgi:hypothetical protein